MITDVVEATWRSNTTCIVAAVALTCAACDSGEPSAADDGPPLVYTTFYPTSYLAERIGGDQVRVVCPVPEDADPIYWMPDDGAITAYQQADLIVVNGADFEKWIERVSLPSLRVVNTSHPFRDRFLHYEEVTTHQHGPGEAHTHEGVDGHTWLDPNNAMIQAEQIKAAMVERWPAHEAEFNQRFEALAADLTELDEAFRSLGPTPGEAPVLASHPAYNYVVDRYGWRVVNLDLQPDALPDAAAMAEIRKWVEEQNASYLLWESAPDAAVAEQMRETFGLTSVVFAPGEMLSAEDVAAGVDYLKLMHQNVENLRQVFSK